MNVDLVEHLLDAWGSDEQFRRRVQVDPQRAVADLGLSLTDDERAAIEHLDLSLSDHDLATRVIKRLGATLSGC